MDSASPAYPSVNTHRLCVSGAVMLGATYAIVLMALGFATAAQRHAPD